VFAKFAGVQALVQILGAVSGIFVVRSLTKQDYALFVVANMILGTMVILSDLGVGSALSALAGKWWTDRVRFGQVIRSALSIRSVLVWPVVVICIPILFWLLLKNGAAISYAILICGAIAAGVGFQINNTILTVIPQFHSQFGRLQFVDFLGAVLRLGLIVAAMFLFINTVIAAAIASVVFGCQYLLLKKWAKEKVELHGEPNQSDRGEIFKVVKKQAPNALYYCFQGQITTFLVSILGSSGNIAELGALTRFFIIFTILQTTFRNLYVPRFAKYETRRDLVRLYLKIVTGFLIVASVPFALLILFPNAFLFVLGAQYHNLGGVLPLLGVTAVLSALAGILVMLNQSRAWIISPITAIGSSVALIAIVAPMVNWKSIHNVLIFQLMTTTLAISRHLYRAFKGFKKI
jgi:O-antigen/teichoic acid export membrane protein